MACRGTGKAVPGGPGQAVAGGPGQAVAGGPGKAVAGGPGKAVAGGPGKAVAGGPGKAVAGGPGKAVAGGPGKAVAGGPGKAVAGGPGKAVAGGPGKAVAGGPGKAVAGGPGKAVAGGPGKAVAGGPGKAVAGGPGKAVAGGPGKAVAGGPGKAVAGGPGKAVAGGPGKAVAGGPGKAVAGGPGKAVAGGPGKAVAGGPGKAVAGGPGQAVAGGPGKAVAGGPGQAVAGGPGKAVAGGLGQAVAGGPGKAVAGGPGKAVAGGPGKAVAGGPGKAVAGGPGKAVPGGPGKAVAGGPGKAVPGGPGKAVPGGPGKAVPGGPGKAVPGGLGKAVPGGLGKAVPGGPGKAVPGGLGKAVPGGLGKAVPGGLGKAVPGGLGKAVPGGLGKAVPGGLGKAVPGGLGKAVPGGPGKAVPGGPGKAVPGGPGKAVPGGPGKAVPGGPGKAVPGGPGKAVPGGPGKAVPGGPGKAVPGGPGKAVPGGPGKAVPGGPGKAVPGGPGKAKQCVTSCVTVTWEDKHHHPGHCPFPTSNGLCCVQEVEYSESVNKSISRKQEDWEAKWKNCLGVCPLNLILNNNPDLDLRASPPSSSELEEEEDFDQSIASCLASVADTCGSAHEVCDEEDDEPLETMVDKSTASPGWVSSVPLEFSEAPENSDVLTEKVESPVKKEDLKYATEKLAEEVAEAVISDSPQTSEGKGRALEDLTNTLAFNPFLARKEIPRTPKKLLTEIRSSWRKAIQTGGLSDTEQAPAEEVIEEAPMDARSTMQKAADPTSVSPAPDFACSLSERKSQFSSTEFRLQEKMMTGHTSESPVSKSSGVRESEQTEEQELKWSVGNGRFVEEPKCVKTSVAISDTCSENSSRAGSLPSGDSRNSFMGMKMHSLPSFEFISIQDETFPEELGSIDLSTSGSTEFGFDVIDSTDDFKNENIQTSEQDLELLFKTREVLKKTASTTEELRNQTDSGGEPLSCVSETIVAPEESCELFRPPELVMDAEERAKMPLPVSCNEREYSLQSLLLSSKHLAEMAATIRGIPPDLMQKIKDIEKSNEKLDMKKPLSG